MLLEQIIERVIDDNLERSKKQKNNFIFPIFNSQLQKILFLAVTIGIGAAEKTKFIKCLDQLPDIVFIYFTWSVLKFMSVNVKEEREVTIKYILKLYLNEDLCRSH